MTPFFARAWSLVVCSALLVVAMTATAFGETVVRDSPRPPAAAVTMPPDILAAQTFLLTAYPDLAAQPLEITLKQIDGAVSVSVAFATEIRDAGPKEPVVTARFEYDAQTRLRRFEAKGSWLEDSRHDALRQQLLLNPRWADSDADVALIRARARPAPSGPRLVRHNPRPSPHSNATWASVAATCRPAFCGSRTRVRVALHPRRSGSGRCG